MNTEPTRRIKGLFFCKKCRKAFEWDYFENKECPMKVCPKCAIKEFGLENSTFKKAQQYISDASLRYVFEKECDKIGKNTHDS